MVDDMMKRHTEAAELLSPLATPRAERIEITYDYWRSENTRSRYRDWSGIF
jgi:hypothetical protein